MFEAVLEGFRPAFSSFEDAFDNIPIAPGGVLGSGTLPMTGRPQLERSIDQEDCVVGEMCLAELPETPPGHRPRSDGKEADLRQAVRGGVNASVPPESIVSKLDRGLGNSDVIRVGPIGGCMAASLSPFMSVYRQRMRLNILRTGRYPKRYPSHVESEAQLRSRLLREGEIIYLDVSFVDAMSMISTEPYALLINGERVPAADGSEFEVLDPATTEPIATVAEARSADVDRAVSAARDTFEAWEQTPPAERARLLKSASTALDDHVDRIGELLSRENGKPISQAKGEVESCARYFEYYAGIADKVHGDSIPLTKEYVDFTVHEPYGVTGHVLPWNFPISLFGRAVAPALATGNVSVVKPAEQTPIATLELGQVLVDAGIPPGVLNIVPGLGPVTGSALANHDDVANVTFTGSVETGREVAKLAVDNVSPVHLELGGKNPVVVFPDADIDLAVDNQLTALFGYNNGQVCSAGSRLLVHENVHDAVVDELVARAGRMSIGPGVEDPDIGALVSEEQYQKVVRYLEIGREEAGAPIMGGEPLDCPGYFVPPTIFDDVDKSARIAQEEIFGPILSVISFETEDEAIALANDVDYGLVAGVFTTDVGRAHRFARDVKAGQIFVNEWFAGGVETPFGGFKDSGFGREKGLEALRNYTQVKNVCLNIETSRE